MASALDRLQAWYLSQCDSEWEHDNGVVVESLDNPGWQLRVDLTGTRWAGRPFDVQQHDRGEHDWLRCWVDATQWQAACGPCNLEEAVLVFLEWVGADDTPAPRGDAVEEWLRQRWMDQQTLASRAREESDE